MTKDLKRNIFRNVLFAIVLMAMTIGVPDIGAKADDYLFVRQPESYVIPLDSTDTYYTVSCEVNFRAYGIELWAGNERLAYSAYWGGSTEPQLDIKRVDAYENARSLKLKVFYNSDYDAENSLENTNYIESNSFTVSKKYIFVEQPKSYVIPLESTDISYTVGCKVNFPAYGIELWSGNERLDYYPYWRGNTEPQIKIDKVDAADKARDLKLRVFYNSDYDYENSIGQTTYIESNIFTVKKQYDFLVAPEDYVLPIETIGNNCTIECEVNFNAKRIELWSGGEEITRASSWLGYSSNPSISYNADPDTKPRDLTLRVIYYEYVDPETNELVGEYIESAPFTVTKEYSFLKQPESYYIPDDETLYGYDITCQVNFRTRRIELWSGDEQIYFTSFQGGGITDTPHVLLATADPKGAPRKYRVRVFYSDFYDPETSVANKEYIDSEEFTVTKDYKFIVQPTDKEIDLNSTDTTCETAWTTSFMPKRIEVYADGEVVKTLYRINDGYSTQYSWPNVQSMTFDADPGTAARKWKVRTYWVWDQEGSSKNRYIESNEFTLIKNYAYLVEPESVVISEDSEETGSNISWQTNFYPEKIEVYSDADDEPIKTISQFNLGSQSYSGQYPEQTMFFEATSDLEPDEYFIRSYYHAKKNEYVDSNVFTVTKSYKFVVQPSDIEIGLNSKDSRRDVTFTLNFVPKKIYVWLGERMVLLGSFFGFEDKEVVLKDFAVPGAIPTELIIQAYYSDSESIMSEPFSIVKYFGFINEPSNVVIESDSEQDKAVVAIETNFIPIKIEVLSDDIVVDTLTSNSSVMDYNLNISIEADPSTAPKRKIIRAYYEDTETGYVETEEFTVTKEVPVKKGDVNGDGVVDTKDVTALKRYLVGGWDVTINEANSDIDGDGEITPLDATLLRRFLVGGWDVELE